MSQEIKVNFSLPCYLIFVPFWNRHEEAPKDIMVLRMTGCFAKAYNFIVKGIKILFSLIRYKGVGCKLKPKVRAGATIHVLEETWGLFWRALSLAIPLN